VTVLAKGRALFPNAELLVTSGGGNTVRVNSISRTAMFLNKIGIMITASPYTTKYWCFVPSTCWRRIRHGILSTTRFTGILFFKEHRLAVYDIGDGKMDWQLRAEKSLFYSRFFDEEFDTTVTGMLFICDEDKRVEIAKRIIRETMWQRKRLIETEDYNERERPLKFARTPIRVTWRYNHVYLTTPKLLKESIKRIADEEINLEQFRGNQDGNHLSKSDFDDCNYRYFVNTATDLLKYVYMFSEIEPYDSINYAIVVPPEDISIAQMYPKKTKGVKFYEYRHSKDFISN